MTAEACNLQKMRKYVGISVFEIFQEIFSLFYQSKLVYN